MSATADARRGVSRWKITVTMLLGLVLLLGTVLVGMREEIALGAEAYLYGLLLVIMDPTRTGLAHTGASADPLQQQ